MAGIAASLAVEQGPAALGRIVHHRRRSSRRLLVKIH
jgi:hypothetical protein